MSSPAIPVLKKEIANRQDEWNKLTDEINQKTHVVNALKVDLELLGRAQSRAWYNKTQAEKALAILERA